MEQFVLIPASVNNKIVTTQSLTTQALPKYKTEQPHTYQIDALKKDINKKRFGQADTPRAKILSYSGIKLANSQTLILDGVDTGALTTDFNLHLRQRNVEVPSIYFTLLTLLEYHPL